MGDYIIESRLITLNSKNALKHNGEYISDLLFSFSSLLTDNNDIIQNSITIESVEIPHSFYNINDSNNVIKLILDAYDLSQPTTYTINITQGNYNANTFITEFKKQYSIATSHTIQMKLNQQTGIFNLSPIRKSSTPVGSTYDPKITILHTGSTAFSVIGLNEGLNKEFVYNTDNPTSFDFPCNFLGAKKLNIYSEALAGNNVDSNALGINTLIASISVNAPIFGLILYNSSSSGQSFLKNRFLSQIDIQIKDEEGNHINFNNINWTITIRLQSYKRHKPNIMEELHFDDELKKERRKNILEKTLENFPDAPITKKLVAISENAKNDLNELNDDVLSDLLDDI